MQSMVRYTEIEKERSRRRQKVLMGSGGMWGGTLKLQMVNAGLIPVKKGNANISLLTKFSKCNLRSERTQSSDPRIGEEKKALLSLQSSFCPFFLSQEFTNERCL